MSDEMWEGAKSMMRCLSDLTALLAVTHTARVLMERRLAGIREQICAVGELGKGCDDDGIDRVGR